MFKRFVTLKDLIVMLSRLPVFTLLFASLLLTHDAYGLATYRATGRAVEVSSNGLLLPPSVGAPDTVFSLRYSLDESQVPTDGGTGGEIAVFRVDSFNGFLGDDIAFSGAGSDLEFFRDFPSFAFSYYVSPDSSLALQGVAADLVSVTGLFVDVAANPAFVNSVIDSGDFPVEEAVGNNGDWSFSAVGEDGGSLEIRGVVDSLVLINGPTGPTDGDNPGMGDDGSGMGDGGSGMDDDGLGMDNGGPATGGGAVPEPGSALIWATLAAIAVSFSRRKAKA